MTNTDTIVFWDAAGEKILTITGGHGVDSAMLIDLFDTDHNRLYILVETGRTVDNTSEESSDEI